MSQEESDRRSERDRERRRSDMARAGRSRASPSARGERPSHPGHRSGEGMGSVLEHLREEDSDRSARGN